MKTRTVLYTNLFVDAPGLPYACARGSAQIGTRGWLTDKGTLCGFCWDAARFTTESAAADAAVNAGVRDILDTMRITD